MSLLIPLPVEGERESNINEALRCDEQLTDYNRRFSGERRPVSFYYFVMFFSLHKHLKSNIERDFLLIFFLTGRNFVVH